MSPLWFATNKDAVLCAPYSVHVYIRHGAFAHSDQRKVLFQLWREEAGTTQATGKAPSSTTSNITGNTRHPAFRKITVPYPARCTVLQGHVPHACHPLLADPLRAPFSRFPSPISNLPPSFLSPSLSSVVSTVFCSTALPHSFLWHTVFCPVGPVLRRSRSR